MLLSEARLHKATAWSVGCWPHLKTTMCSSLVDAKMQEYGAAVTEVTGLAAIPLEVSSNKKFGLVRLVGCDAIPQSAYPCC